MKEYIQSLSDEGKIQVDKIGNGNWYWCFISEEKRQCENQIAGLEQETSKVRKSCGEAELALTTEKERREREEGEGQVINETLEKEEREGLLKRKSEMEREIQLLQAEERDLLDSSSSGPQGVSRKKEDMQIWKQEAMMWTDNIYILEEYIKKLAMGDGDIVEAMQRECYGKEYVEGEGLRELS